MTAGTLAAVFVALYVGHTVGDHWVQTGHQAATKGQRDYGGRVACGRHVATLTATQVVFLAPLAVWFGVRPVWWHVVAGLVVNAVTHYWADRRFTLAWLAHRLGWIGKDRFYALGFPRSGADDNPCLGTGAYALDQSYHVAWLFAAAMIISA